MRLGELEQLDWGDVDEPRQRWRVSQAVVEDRTRPLGQRRARRLRRRLRARAARRPHARPAASSRASAAIGSGPRSRAPAPRPACPRSRPRPPPPQDLAPPPRRRPVGADRRARRPAQPRRDREHVQPRARRRGRARLRRTDRGRVEQLRRVGRAVEPAAPHGGPAAGSARRPGSLRHEEEAERKRSASAAASSRMPAQPSANSVSPTVWYVGHCRRSGIGWSSFTRASRSDEESRQRDRRRPRTARGHAAADACGGSANSASARYHSAQAVSSESAR